MTLDGSLGPGGALQGPDYVIPAEVGQLHGSNLFHSFGQFNIQTGERAIFTGPASVDNIISRVTGGDPSLIDGLLQTDIPGASLYLLNPSGVLFGPNAQLNVSGSFHVSTANGIRFHDGATFSANLSEQSSLTVSAPVAFGFLDNHPAGITIQGSQLSVSPGEALSLTGGDITMTGGLLEAPSGRIDLTSVAAPGEVQVEVVEHTSRLTDHRPTRLGSVLISDGAQVSASGEPGGTILVESHMLTLANGAVIESGTSGAGQGGDVRVEAQTVAIHDSQIQSFTMGAGRGGDVTLVADTLTIDGSSSGLITATKYGIGDAGNVWVEARTVTVTNGALIGSGAFHPGSGRGGNVTVIAQDAVTLDGTGIGVTPEGQEFPVPSAITTASQEGTTGDAGNVRMEAHTVTVTNGAQIQSGTFGAGRGGDLTVIAQDAVILDGFGGGLLSLITASTYSTEPTGHAGNVQVEAQTVTATNGAQISSVTFGAGQGGSVTVRAHEHVTFRGTSPEGVLLEGELGPGDLTYPSGAFANSHRTGAPGIVHVIAPEITLAEGGRISSLNIASAEAGGTVIVDVFDTLEISGVGSSLRTSSSGPGQGGDIVVNAGTIILTEGADLSAASTGSGDAGKVTVTASQRLLMQNSAITTRAAQAKGGNITLRVQDMIQLRDSQITTAVGTGAGAGGDITIDPASEFVVLEGSLVSANAVAGPGGNITIRAGVFLTDPFSSITASSVTNIPGAIDIQAQITNLIDVVTPLPPDFAPVGALLHDPCVARLRAGTVSSFVVHGRTSLPATYDDPLPTRLYESEHRTPLAEGGQPPREMAAASHVPTMLAGTHSPIRLDLPCPRS